MRDTLKQRATKIGQEVEAVNSLPIMSRVGHIMRVVGMTVALLKDMAEQIDALKVAQIEAKEAANKSTMPVPAKLKALPNG